MHRSPAWRVAPPAANPAPGQRQPKGVPQSPPTLQPGDEVVTEPPAQKIINKKASFSGLDKITGRIINFDEEIGETVQFGALRVKTDACYTRPATEAANTDAFVEVDEITLQGEVKRIFSGWMFAASPGLHCGRTSDLRYLADRLQGAANHRRYRATRNAETAAAAAGPEARATAAPSAAAGSAAAAATAAPAAATGRPVRDFQAVAVSFVIPGRRARPLLRHSGDADCQSELATSGDVRAPQHSGDGSEARARMGAHPECVGSEAGSPLDTR